ncbi:MAG: nuclear transport factor 2 family protein [Porphyromonas sp.]|nr:nuclear transport factor 2 family protein [Porphyromonas sp.]
MTKTAKLMTVLATAVLGLSCGTSKDQVTKETKKTMNPKEQVVALLKSIETGDTAPVAFINPNKYTQHNLAIKDGLAGFGAALSALPQGTARVNTVRVFQDGDFVFAHTDYNFFGPKIGFDIFRFQDGKIVEHWDNLAETPTNPNPSGHTMIDGTTAVKDLDKTASNKALVEQFVRDVLMGQAPEKLTSYFDGDKYIQHNPAIADGLSGLGAALAEMAKNGITMKYDRIHKVLGEGNFVLVVNEGEFAGKHVSFYDLFRVESGKIAEHWDVIENIIPQSEWQHQNGKFGF